MANTLTTKEVAEKLETTTRTLRKFVRSEVKEAGGKIGEDTPGKGGRYSFEAKEVAGMKKRFRAWSKSQAEARAARLAKEAEANDATSEDDADDTVDADAE